MACRILLVDPCPIVHTGVTAIVKGTEFTIALATDSVAEAVTWMNAELPQLVMCDLEFRDGNSRDLARVANRLEIPLVLFSDWNNPVFISRMVEAGARGLIGKSSSADEILGTLQKVASGKKTWQRKDIRRFTGALATPRLEHLVDFPLTQREFEILEQVANGQTNKMIAEKLGISYETVKEHVQHVLLKLGVNDRTQAAVMAVRRGLL